MASQESQPLYWHYSGFDGNFQIRGRTLFFVVVILSFVLLLMTLLFLYARWVCKSHSLRSTASDATSAPHLAHAPPPQPQGLDTTTINGIPVILHQSSTTTKTAASESECCCICLGEFQDGDRVRVLPKCNHFYHSECVDKWFAAQSSCPLCRSSLRADSPV